MPRDQKKSERTLQRKGFILDNRDHKYFVYIASNGIDTGVTTKTSHGEKELSDNMLNLMARQCKLSRKEFLDLIDCPLSREQYEKILTDKGFLNSN
ncbi:MAG: hypothetical protein QM537_05045 [Candidatus Symbiobacter sp.]|nr:hypothetical protein [Candidatus Symbiobacter sp.]